MRSDYLTTIPSNSEIEEVQFPNAKGGVRGPGHTPARKRPGKIETQHLPLLGKTKYIPRPEKFDSDIGFYENWIPFFELRNIPWRRLRRKAPKPGVPGGQHKKITTEWNMGHDSVLKDMRHATLLNQVM